MQQWLLTAVALFWSYTTDPEKRRRRIRILIPFATVVAMAALMVMVLDAFGILPS